MAARTSSARRPAECELLITRIFDAPRSLVFRAWIEPSRAGQWWGPQGFTVISIAMDVRPGGAWRKCIRSPEGTEFWRSGVYQEVVEPERLVFTYVSDDPQGTQGHETLVTVIFGDLGEKTLMTFRQAEFESRESRDSHRGGWTSCMEHFAQYLARAR